VAHGSVAGTRVLLTALGIQANPARYRLGEREHEARLAPIALVRLAPEPPSVVLAVCTAKAREKTLDVLRMELAELPVEVRPIDVPDGVSIDEITRFLELLTNAVADLAPVRLDIDLTHGYRHHAVLLYAVALYLEALSGVAADSPTGEPKISVERVHYGLLEKLPAPSLFLDLRPLVELPGWVHALRTFAETGSTHALVERVRSFDSSEISDGPIRQEMVTHLNDVGSAITWGLPLELGRATQNLKNAGKSLEQILHRLPLGKEVATRLVDVVDRWVLGTSGGDGWKSKVVLDDDELRRQAELVDWLRDHSHVPEALGLMREWVVSRIVLATGNATSWLDKDTRRRAEWLLGTFRSLAQTRHSDLLSAEQAKLASLWGDIADLRNALHHHGMSGEAINPRDGLFKTRENRIRDAWSELRRLPTLDLRIGGRDSLDRILVCPLGIAPGVLYNALRAASPDRTLVVCSEESKGLVDDAARAAGFSSDRILTAVMADPHSGFQEIGEIVERWVPELVTAKEVVVCLTGGTTMMGIAVAEVAGKAESLSLPVKRFVLIDRRPHNEQQSHPYVDCDTRWLPDRPGRDTASR